LPGGLLTALWSVVATAAPLVAAVPSTVPAIVTAIVSISTLLSAVLITLLLVLVLVVLRRARAFAGVRLRGRGWSVYRRRHLRRVRISFTVHITVWPWNIEAIGVLFC
jgi:hypothetical protein